MDRVQKILDDVTRKLEGLPGVVGVVLGGSRAKGTHRPDSDIDIGIYYDESKGFEVRSVGEIATELDDEHRTDLITSLGAWGPWVNGGGWLVIGGYHVDFLFRDVRRVAQVIDDCAKGIVTADYQTGHPHAYLNLMYMGEVDLCRVLADPERRIAELKAKTRPYPKALQEAVIGRFLFEASFSLMFAEANRSNDDLAYVSGCCFRAVACLNHVLFANNEEYCINEKKAEHYKERVDQVFTKLSSKDGRGTEEAVATLRQLISETEELVRR
ncbi:MAG: nucleotidyltransferase domain-containing protein [Planifilum fimeticola]